jgi:hypothetical protein
MSISNTYQPNAPQAKTGTGSAISNREDLSNELTLLAPEETPLLSLCSKGKASGTFSEWTADVLSAPSTAGISEGTDVTAFDDKFASRARLGNYTQIFRRDYIVSNLQQAVSSVGPANVAQAEAKSMRELKRDVEAAICSDNDRTVENGAGTPYALRGLGDWLDSAGPSDVPAAYRTPTDSILTASPSDTTFNNIIASIYTVNGEANNLTLIAGVALRKVISNFQRSSGQATSPAEAVYRINQDASSKKITHAVTLYESDFGIVNVINANPSCMPNANRGYVVNPKYLGFNTLIPMGSTRLENQGGGERGFVDMVGTLVCKHPGAHGKIAYS